MNTTMTIALGAFLMLAAVTFASGVLLGYFLIRLAAWRRRPEPVDFDDYEPLTIELLDLRKTAMVELAVNRPGSLAHANARTALLLANRALTARLGQWDEHDDLAPIPDSNVYAPR